MLRERTSTTIALTLALVALGGCAKEELNEPPKPTRVRILATTDEHSHVLATSPEKDEWPLAATANAGAVKLRGGIARRATVIDAERADGVPTVLLSNGDYSQGTLSAVTYTKANFDVFLMRHLGYDAIAMGNHEFDLGPGKAYEAVAAAKAMGGAPPFVLTNAIFSSADTTLGHSDDTLAGIYGGVGSGKDVVSGLIVDKGGVKVGVVSAMGPSAAFDVQYQAAPVTFFSPVTATTFGTTYITQANAKIAATLQPVIDQLRAGGAQVVVLLFHGGLASTGSNGDLDGTRGIVAQLQRVDLIMGGHTHGINGSTNTTAHVTDKDGRDVPVMQPAPYGNQVARAEFDLSTGQATFDDTKDGFIDVDDHVVPTSNAAVRAGISTTISSVESALLGGTLTLVTGATKTDNGGVAGDLYFYPLARTTYDVTGAGLPQETNALNLDTDAILSISNEQLALGSLPAATVALQNAGSIRGDLTAGATGELGFSDVFRMVSLGGDAVEGSPGFPIVHAYINLASLRAAYEQTLYMSLQNNDYFVSPAGLKVWWTPMGSSGARLPWDGTTSPTTPGWVTKMATVDSGGTETVFYDEADTANGGWPLGPTSPANRVHVVTPYLVAAFAGNVGVKLYANPSPLDTAEVVLSPLDATGFNAACVQWQNTAHLKDHQAVARYLYGLGDLPAGKYAAAAPSRVICSGAGCP